MITTGLVVFRSVAVRSDLVKYVPASIVPERFVLPKFAFIEFVPVRSALDRCVGYKSAIFRLWFLTFLRRLDHAAIANLLGATREGSSKAGRYYQ
mgnify:CR=1 FL=1